VVVASLVEGSPDRPDHAVSHTRRGDHIRARFGLRNGRLGQQIQRLVVFNSQRRIVLRVGFDDATVAVIGVLTETDIADDVGVGVGTDFADAALDDAILGVGLGADVVFRVGDAEDDDRLDAGLADLFDPGGSLVDGYPFVAWHRGDLQPLVDGFVDEYRGDEVLCVEARLPDERPDAVGSETARPMGGLE